MERPIKELWQKRLARRNQHHFFNHQTKEWKQDLSTRNVKWIGQVDLGFQQEVEVITIYLNSILDTQWGLPFGKPLSFLAKKKSQEELKVITEEFLRQTSSICTTGGYFR